MNLSKNLLISYKGYFVETILQLEYLRQNISKYYDFEIILDVREEYKNICTCENKDYFYKIEFKDGIDYMNKFLEGSKIKIPKELKTENKLR